MGGGGRGFRALLRDPERGDAAREGQGEVQEEGGERRLREAEGGGGSCEEFRGVEAVGGEGSRVRSHWYWFEL